MYSYQCGLQSIENRANVQTKGSGFDQYVDFNIRLSKNSSQPSNQGYVKLLQGMMSMADFIGKFSEGYKCCYVCEIEEFETLPQGAKSGIYENTLLFGYTSTRTDLVSFLCFVVLSGKGSLKYEGVDYELGAGDCVFIDCRKAYSHSTSDDLGRSSGATSMHHLFQLYMKSTKSEAADLCSTRRILNRSLHF